MAPIPRLGQVRYRGQALRVAGRDEAVLQAKAGLGLINASPVTAGVTRCPDSHV